MLTKTQRAKYPALAHSDDCCGVDYTITGKHISVTGCSEQAISQAATLIERHCPDFTVATAIESGVTVIAQENDTLEMIAVRCYLKDMPQTEEDRKLRKRIALQIGFINNLQEQLRPGQEIRLP